MDKHRALPWGKYTWMQIFSGSERRSECKGCKYEIHPLGWECSLKEPCKGNTAAIQKELSRSKVVELDLFG